MDFAAIKKNLRKILTMNEQTSKEYDIRKDQRAMEDFKKLCEIVAESFRVDPELIPVTTRGGAYKVPRHLVACLFSNWGTLRETADLLGMNNHGSVCYSRRRVQSMLAEGRYKDQILAVLERVESELPLMLP